MSTTHNHNTSTVDSTLRLSLFLNSAFTLFEFIVGILSGSLALISDAGHNLTDSVSLLISLLGNKISQREANIEHSYGYGRATILTALLNASILGVLALYIFFEAYNRILNPHPVEGKTIIFVAFIGILVNGFIAFLLNKNKDDLNVKSAFMNMALDALALVGTLIAGVLIIITKQPIFDPLISIFIGVMLLYGAYGVLRSAIHVLLEGVPEGLDVEKIKEAVKQSRNVKGVDDMHIWAISSRYAALSCHIIIEDCDVEESTKIVKEIKEVLKEKFHIEHATIETELVECPPNKE